jgi:AcrR family transcriptional regulator
MAPAVAAPPARRRNRRGEGSRLREEIITAASQIIGEAGDDTALTLRGVARRLGIAAPSIYRHFTDAGQLKMAVVRRAFADFARARDAASGDGDDPAARLLARCRAYTGFALANPGPYRYLFSQHAPTGDPRWLAGPDHASRRGRGGIIRRSIIWRSNHACGEWLCRIADRAVACCGAGLRREHVHAEGPEGPALSGQRPPLPARPLSAQVQLANPVYLVRRADRGSAPITRLIHLPPPSSATRFRRWRAPRARGGGRGYRPPGGLGRWPATMPRSAYRGPAGRG